MTFLTGIKNIHMQGHMSQILCKKIGKICNLNVSDIVAFSINLHTKCVFLVMFRPPLPPCTHLYAFVLTPPPPLDAYVINGRPQVTIEGHKGQILGQNLDLTYFQHMAFWEIIVTEVESD